VKELQRPILKEDYENIYAVSTTNLYENCVDEPEYEDHAMMTNKDLTANFMNEGIINQTTIEREEQEYLTNHNL